MEFDYSHNLSDEAVRARLSALGDYLQNRHGIAVTWDGDDRALFKGKYKSAEIDGAMTFGPRTLHFKGKDPGWKYRKLATWYIQKKLKAYFDESTPLDQLPRS